jgi:hypothetical protein
MVLNPGGGGESPGASDADELGVSAILSGYDGSRLVVKERKQRFETALLAHLYQNLN